MNGQQIIVTIAADGEIKAETVGIKGARCLDFVEVLENLMDATSFESKFTSEYHEIDQQSTTEGTLRNEN
jgi:hypothetical protein